MKIIILLMSIIFFSTINSKDNLSNYIFQFDNFDDKRISTLVEAVHKYNLDRIFFGANFNKLQDNKPYRDAYMKNYNTFLRLLKERYPDHKLEISFIVLQSPHFARKENHNNSIQKLKRDLAYIIANFKEFNGEVVIDIEELGNDEIRKQFLELIIRIHNEVKPQFRKVNILLYYGLYLPPLVDIAITTEHKKIAMTFTYVLPSRSTGLSIMNLYMNYKNKGISFYIDVSNEEGKLYDMTKSQIYDYYAQNLGKDIVNYENMKGIVIYSLFK